MSVREFNIPRFTPPATRAQSTREGETRREFERPPMDRWAPASVLTMPPELDGYKFRWISEYVRGQFQDGNINKAYQEGYIPVHRDEIPRFYAVAPSEDGCIRMGGLILMKIPEHFARQRQAHYQRKSHEAVHSADVMQGLADGPGVKLPVFKDDQSRTLEGSEAFRALHGRNQP